LTVSTSKNREGREKETSPAIDISGYAPLMCVTHCKLLLRQYCRCVRPFQSSWEWILARRWQIQSSHWLSQLIATSFVEHSPAPPCTTCSTGWLSSFYCHSKSAQVFLYFSLCLSVCVKRIAGQKGGGFPAVRTPP